jgi:phosphoribosylformylglycinamidine synthase
VGETRDELGGSHFALVNGLSGGQVPAVDAQQARTTFAAVHQAISDGLVRACHDLSEGGLAVAAAEMAFAGGLGARLDVGTIAADRGEAVPAVALFSESNTRFLCEVAVDKAAEIERVFEQMTVARVGEVVGGDRLLITAGGRPLVDADIRELKEAWQGTFRW